MRHAPAQQHDLVLIQPVRLSVAGVKIDGMSYAVAKVAHAIPGRPPLQLAVGERVLVGDRDSEWPEFVFVTAAHGTGWVPARHLSASSGAGVVQTPYDTTELRTEIGDVLKVVVQDLESGWLWCRSRNGREGLVPAKTLEISDYPGGRSLSYADRLAGTAGTRAR